MDLRSPARLAWASLIVAWFFDFLFWNKAPGISLLIFIALLFIGLLLVAWGEGRLPGRAGWLLVPFGLLFAAVPTLRAEPLTALAGAALALFCLALFTATFLSGRWFLFSLSDYVVQTFLLAGAALVLTSQTWSGRRRLSREAAAASAPDTASSPADPASSARRAQSASVVRGIFLALPVLAILTALLASADPVFNRGVSSFFGLFQLDRFGEYLFRAVYILILAYLLTGVALHALTSSREVNFIGLKGPWLTPFLGWTETAILLGSVDLLFAVFVGIQFRYLFGGQANIQAAGFTYAEYARRGFFELVAVAVISLLIVLSLSTAAKRGGPRQSRAFQVLVVGLVALVVVILISAWQRLQLYEAAYGFSRQRLYTHIFIPWLGLLLITAAGLELFRRPRAFALLALAVAAGFGASLALVNVDDWIARQNVARAVQGAELDIPYLVTLSDDAVPTLFDALNNPSLPKLLHDQVGAALVCRMIGEPSTPQATIPWQSYRLPQAHAAALFAANQDRLTGYSAVTSSDEGLRQIIRGGQIYKCEAYSSMD
jgi:hypothetical protein